MKCARKSRDNWMLCNVHANVDLSGLEDGKMRREGAGAVVV